MSKKFLALAAAATLAGNAFAQEQATADTATAKLRRSPPYTACAGANGVASK